MQDCQLPMHFEKKKEMQMAIKGNDKNDSMILKQINRLKAKIIRH
jgi:hypothetical protein